MKILFKILLITSIIGLFIILYLPIKMFINYWFDDLDFCLDTGVCQEGLPLNTEKGKIIVNKDTCLDHNGKWDEKYTRCHFQRPKFPIEEETE